MKKGLGITFGSFCGLVLAYMIYQLFNPSPGGVNITFPDISINIGTKNSNSKATQGGSINSNNGDENTLRSETKTTTAHQTTQAVRPGYLGQASTHTVGNTTHWGVTSRGSYSITGKWAIQVAAPGLEQEALAIVNHLKLHRVENVWAARERVSGKFRVRIVGFSSEKEARAVAGNLKREGVIHASWVTDKDVPYTTVLVMPTGWKQSS